LYKFAPICIIFLSLKPSHNYNLRKSTQQQVICLKSNYARVRNTTQEYAN